MNATVTIYTVTAGKTLQLVNCWLNTLSWNVGITQAGLFVTNAADVRQYYILQYYLPAESFALQTQQMPKPLIVPAEFKVKIISSSVSNPVYGGFLGFEI